jgi:hypothetical protein
LYFCMFHRRGVSGAPQVVSSTRSFSLPVISGICSVRRLRPPTSFRVQSSGATIPSSVASSSRMQR